MGATKCPSCGLFNPDSSERCDCGYDFRKRALPDGHNKPAKTNPAVAAVGLIVLAVIAWYYLGGGLENQAARNLQQIEDKVAADAVTKYEIAKRNGTAMDVCVQAGMVSAAYLQAKDEPHYYRQWKEAEKSDCAKAGLSR